MVRYMKEPILLVKSKDKVIIVGLMGIIITESFQIMILRVKVNLNGVMEGNTKDNGLRIRCMVKENLHGLMVENTQVLIIE